MHPLKYTQCLYLCGYQSKNNYHDSPYDLYYSTPLREGQEEVFQQFEALAIPIIGKCNGKLLLRIKAGHEGIIEANMEIPYEIHLVCFATEDDFENFKLDEERKQFLHLKDQSIRDAFLIQGTRL